jgi:phage-related protein
MADKPLCWLGSSKIDISDFPQEARRKAGFQLRIVQQGQTPTDFKAMPIVGKGVEEIRIRTDEAYRVFYVARFEEAVYVLHVFQKTTQKTSKQDIEIGQQRYQEITYLKKQQQDND